MCKPLLCCICDSMMLKKNKETNNSRCPEDSSRTLQIFLISITTLVLEAIILVILLIFRQFLWLFLKLKYGKRFGGLMSARDSIWMGEDDSAHINHTVILFDSKMTADEFNNHILKSIDENSWQHNHPLTELKVSCSYEVFMGYVFYLKENMKKSDCFVTLNVGESSQKFIEKSDLTNILSECGNRPLGLNNKALWELVMINKPLRTEDTKKGVYTYVLIFRTHHAIGDGMTTVNFLFRNMADDQVEVHESLAKLLKKMYNRDAIFGKPSIVNTIKNILKLVKFVLVSPIVIRNEKLRLGSKENVLHGPRLSGDKHIVYSTEGNEEQLLNLMKYMKKRVPGASITAVAVTAISRALQKYFDVNCKETPKSVIASLPVSMAVPEIERKIKLKNSVSTALVSVPIIQSQASVRDQLAAVVEEIQTVKSKPNVMVKYMMATGFTGYVPRNMMQHLFTASVATFSFSNVPGIPKTKCLQHVIRDIFFITPNMATTGLGFSLITYRDALSFGFIVDKILIPRKEAAQDLLDSVLEEISLMYEEFKISSS